MPTEFKPLNIAILTISDSRDETSDTSGQALVDGLQAAGHRLAEKLIVPDNTWIIRRELSRWIADDGIQAIISSGGTGLTGRDGTPEAVVPLFDRTIEGFGELFRWLSYEEVGTSTIASRAIAGVANGCFVFCLPGSTNACKTGWSKIIEPQLDARNRPCNLTDLLPRLKES